MEYEGFMRMLSETEESVTQALHDAQTGKGSRSEQQLSFILRELRLMQSALQDGAPFHPYYPRGISDDWQRHDPLGEKLMDLADLFSKLKTQEKEHKHDCI